MYRQGNGSLSFSWNRLLTNTFPNFASTSDAYSDLTPSRQDLLYSYQLSTPTPTLLGPIVFHTAGCTDTERRSLQIHRALEKNGVLDPTGRVETSKIGPQFIHQLAFIDQMSQKKLINVLFFWEEEVQRLNKLDQEEVELTGLIEVEEKRAEGTEQLDSQKLDRLRFERERVRMKRRQKPTQRRGDVEADQDTTVRDAFRAGDNVPGYVNADGQDLPPSYHPGQQAGSHASVSQ